MNPPRPSIDTSLFSIIQRYNWWVAQTPYFIPPSEASALYHDMLWIFQQPCPRWDCWCARI